VELTTAPDSLAELRRTRREKTGRVEIEKWRRR